MGQEIINKICWKTNQGKIFTHVIWLCIHKLNSLTDKCDKYLYNASVVVVGDYLECWQKKID